MAEILENHAFKKPTPSGGSVFPWDLWTDGQIWKLTRGVDFDGRPVDLVTQMHRAARVRGMICRTSRTSTTLVVQFQPREDTTTP